MASTVTVEPSSTNVVTSIVSASSQPASTQLITSVVTESASNGGSTNAPVTVVVTSVYNPSTTTAARGSSTSSAASSSSSAAGSLPNGTSNKGSNNSSGLSTGGKTAIAVVVPVVVVALLVLAGLFFWRKRKQGKIAKEERRKEVEEYGYNPNNDPTLPVVAADGSEMAEDSNGGYRGWGNTSMSNRKASTTLSGGHTAGQLSDTGSQPGGYVPGSPTGNNFSDGHSGDTLMNQRETFSSDDLGALGAAPVAGAHRNNNDIRRGPSNASSSYSAGNHSERSDVSAGVGQSNQAYSPTEMYGGSYGGFGQHGPYGDGSYGGGDSGMPIVRDVSARRNTRIEAGGNYQSGNSGIAQNF